jgi:hypothetical protein
VRYGIVIHFLVSKEMVLGPDSINVADWTVGKSKLKKKKDGAAEESGCWIKFRFIGSCISSRTRVDSSISGTSTQYGII